MNHGAFITIGVNEIRISKQELEPIGITNKSVCWAKPIPNRHKSKPDEPHDHLIISPFEFNSWPILFRIKILLSEEPGSLQYTLEALRALNFNILAIEGNPSGHNHAVMNIIGEPLNTRKEHEKLFQSIEELPDEDRNFENKKLDQIIHKKFTPLLLQKSEEIKSYLIDFHNNIKISNNGKGFLRESFIHNDRNGKKGSLYNPYRLPAIEITTDNSRTSTREIGMQHATQAIQCEWLQQHAFFWIYGKKDTTTDDKPNNSWIFEFNAKEKSLTPQEDRTQNKYKELARKIEAPSKSIASINYHEHYIRIALSKLDSFGKSHLLEIPYSASYSSRADTKGLLATVVTALSQGQQLLIRTVAMSTSSKTHQKETGKFTFSVSSDMSMGENLNDRTKIIKDRATSGMRHAQRELGPTKCELSIGEIKVTPFSAKSLFLSTKFEWLEKNNLFDKIKKIANKQGFILVTGDKIKIPIEHEHRWENSKSLPENITTLIRGCDAFLQIIPEEGTQNSDKSTGIINENTHQRHKNEFQWMLFEAGGAILKKMPVEACVQTSENKNINHWNEELQIYAGKHLNEFSDTDNLMTILNDIISELAKERRANEY